MNSTPYLVEVVGGDKVAPLACDAAENMVYTNVVKANGSKARILAIPPAVPGRNASARFVFVPANGGLGQVDNGSGREVDFIRYVVDPMHPATGSATYAGLPIISKYYSVPRTDGNWIWIQQ